MRTHKFSVAALAAVLAVSSAGFADDAADEAFYKQAKEIAAAEWPALKAKFKTEEGFDPADAAAMKGKLIQIETDNLIGYKFKPGDFPFATTVNGVPVAATYDAKVAAAVKAIEAKLKRGLGDNDDDGRWTVICRVTGKTGKLVKKVDVEGTVKDDAGITAAVTGERAETVDAPVLTVVAAYIGPLAVANPDAK